VAWGAGGPGQSGSPHYRQSVVPAPNTGFVGVAAGHREVHVPAMNDSFGLD